MPLPTPLPQETQELWTSRCMENEKMQEEFPEGDQRLAVCNQIWNEERGEKSMKKKQLSVTTKALNEEERIIRFIASTENTDRDDDIIEVAGWELEEYKKNPVFLDFHDWFKAPLGKCINIIKDITAKQLIMDIKFPTIDELSSDGKNISEHAKYIDTIYMMYKNKYMNAVSVGFEPIEAEQRDPNNMFSGNKFKKQTLLELSAVSIPANADAVAIMRSKGFNQKQINKFTKHKESKTKDTQGNPSVRDIERAIDTELNKDHDEDMMKIWSTEIYPVNYPSGHFIAYDHNTDKMTMHDYTYTETDRDVVINIDQGVEVEQTIELSEKAKEKLEKTNNKNKLTKTSKIGSLYYGISVDTKGFNNQVEKAIEQIEEAAKNNDVNVSLELNPTIEMFKAGAELSKKNLKMLREAAESISKGLESINNMISTSQAENDEKNNANDEPNKKTKSKSDDDEIEIEFN
ncbi:MAG: hypothetical protein FH761_16640 [Firmicutes bacterium]|nr:hypothetical protein [Bacillota bacterium]